VVYGAVEGLTELLPVSSTGHLRLLDYFLGLGQDPLQKTFDVLIQLGAILAIMVVYFGRLLSIAIALPSSAEARRFVIGVLIAFLPAMVIGAALHDIIKNVFFESPRLICTSLLIGGVVLLAVDRYAPAPRYDEATKLPLWMYLAVGFCQCLALIPGVSRSGATIAGAVLMGTAKRAAAEFSFFLAMPTMAAAFTYDLWKSRGDMDFSQLQYVGTGFVAAFIAGVIVVKLFLDIVSRYGFAPFAWYRIIVGAAGLIAVTLLPTGHLPRTAALEPPAVTRPAG
jgi:undecaprenyl-diphosphatase